MKRFLILAIILMLLLPSVLLLADEYELGIALTPMDVLKSDEDRSMEVISEGDNGGLNDFVLGLHLGYSFAWLFYASVDANAMPPWWVAKMTATQNEDGSRVPGLNSPGFVTFLDVGFRPTIGSLILMAELGLNHFYIKDGADAGNKLGVNFRMGVGYKFDPFSVSLIATSIFPDFQTMKYVFKALSNDEEWASEALGKSIIPSIALYLHL